MVINTNRTGSAALQDSYSLRRTTLLQGVPYFTTVSGALAAVHAIEAGLSEEDRTRTTSLQEYHAAPAFDAENAPTDRVGYR